MRKISCFTGILVCWFITSCRPPNNHAKLAEGVSQQYVQLLERIESAGNQYRQAIDLLRYADSSLERGLAESHLDVSRQFLESQFQIADIESKGLALKESDSSAAKTGSGISSDDLQYEKIVEEVWTRSAELDTAKAHFEKARVNLKKATTPEAFRRAQIAMDLSQKEVMIADKKLDLAGSNLDIQDYQRKKSASKGLQSFSLADRIKLLKEELLTSSGKVAVFAGMQNKGAELNLAQTSPDIQRRGLLLNIQDYLDRSRKLKIIQRAKKKNLEMVQVVRSTLDEHLLELEKLQLEHMELNQKTTSIYNQAYNLVKNGGKQEEVKGLFDTAEQQMSLSTRLDEQKELAKRAISLIRNQDFLVQEDSEKIIDWLAIASEDRKESLYRVANRTGIVLMLIAVVLVISFYLKRLPYRFMQEGKNAFYFRKLIGFCSALMIGGIILINFISDFGSITAVIGLAGAGLAIALQDPILSLAGWFLIVGKFGISVGDRIEINQVKGDVIDIGLFRLAILEVGNWVSAEQSTGRVVFFPNSFILKNHYYNYSTGNSFIWDEIKVTLTSESDWQKAKQIVENIASRVSQEFIGEAKEKSDEIARRFHINLGTLTPIVYVSIGERGVDLLLRYLTAIRKRRMTNDQISREILASFEGDSRLVLAYPARGTTLEPKNVPGRSPSNPEPETPHPGKA